MSDYTKALTRFQQADQVDSVTVDQALQEVERSIASEPTGNSYLELPLLLRAKGKDKQALSILAGAISANPDYDDARVLWSFLNAAPK